MDDPGQHRLSRWVLPHVGAGIILRRGSRRAPTSRVARVQYYRQPPEHLDCAGDFQPREAELRLADANFASGRPAPAYDSARAHDPDGRESPAWKPDPELQMVLLCARPWACAPEQAALTAAAARVTDWDRFFELGLWHGLVPLINRLHERRPFLPEAAAGRIAQAARITALRALRYSAALLRVVDTLEGAEVPVVALKGPVLAAQAYGDPALRSFSDLDILVHEEHVRPAITALRGLGYDPVLPGDEIGRNSLRARQHSILHHHGSGIHLELHWRLARGKVGFVLRTGEVSDRAEPVALLGRPVLSLAPVDQFVYLAVHAANDGWRELEDFRCLGELATQHPEIDWSDCLRQAQFVGAGRRVRVVLQILAGLGVSWDGSVMRDALADRSAVELSHAARASWGAVQTPRPGAIGPTALLVRSFDSRRARAGYALSTIFEADEADMAAWRLPRGLYPLYALARPGRLMLRAARQALSGGAKQAGGEPAEADAGRPAD